MGWRVSMEKKWGGKGTGPYGPPFKEVDGEGEKEYYALHGGTGNVQPRWVPDNRGGHGTGEVGGGGSLCTGSF